MSNFKYDPRTLTASGMFRKYILVGWNIKKINDCYMMECPSCECCVIMEHYLMGVGTMGVRFCPYCGKDIKGGSE